MSLKTKTSLASLMIASILATDFTLHFAREYYGTLHDEYYYFDKSIGKLHRVNRHIKVPWVEASTGHVTLTTNNLGFREDRTTIARQTILQRMMVFGDSHTDGMVDNSNSFPHVAEAILNERRSNVEIVNAGVGFFSLYQQLLLFERYVSLSPDVAVFTFYSGNDWFDILRKREVPHLRIDDMGVISEYSPVRDNDRLSRKEKILLFIDDHSSLLYSLHRLYYNTAANWRKPRIQVVTYEKGVLQKASEVSEPALWQSLNQAYHFKVRPEDFAVATQFHRYVITEISMLAKKNGISVLFVILPTKYQVERESDLEVFSTLETLLELDPGHKEDERVRQAFMDLLVEAGLEYLDPYEQFSALTPRSSEPLYWKRDHHLSDRGHRALGALLAPQLARVLHNRENVTHVSHEPAARAARLLH